MKKITRFDFLRNQTKSTNRWLGWLTFCMMLLTSYGYSQQCEIAVTISWDDYADTTTWELLDGNGQTVLSGGPYDDYGSSDTQTYQALSPPYSLKIVIDDWFWCDNVIDYSVTVGGNQDIQGTVFPICSDINTEIIPLTADLSACIPSCPAPLGLAITPTSLTAVNLSWTAVSNAALLNSYEYAVTTSATPPASGTAITGTSVSVSDLTSDTTHYLHVRTNCDTADISTWATKSFYLGYCLPSYIYDGCLDGDRISNVTLQGESITLNNNSTCSPNNYGNYTGLSGPDLAPGNTYNISISTDYDSPIDEKAKAWIDYNKDGVFSENELIANTGAAGLAGYTSNFSFTVPIGLTAGDYRMRVRIAYVYDASPTFDACSNIGYGEVEDYTISIIQLDNCTGTPNAGTVTSPIYACSNENFVLSTLGATAPADGLTGIWQSSPAGMNNWIDIAGATSVNYTMTGGITSNTDFRYKMTCSNSNETDISDTIAVIMNAAIDCYCIPTGTSTTNYITGFTTSGGTENISNTDNGLSAGGYGDFFLFHNLTQEIGDSVDFEVTTFGTATSGLKIWVDWNQNGSFDDDGELVYATTTYANIHTGSFVVSNTALEGQTRMRIGNSNTPNSGPSGPCLTNLSGEYEDYMLTVYVPVCAKPFDLALDAITPNSATISWTSTGSLFDIELGEEGFFQSGIPTTSGVTNPHTINGLDSSTTYEFYVRQDCGADGYSNWAGPFSFTTECLPPSITETTGDTICGEGEANLTVVTDGDVVSWYTSETGGIKIGSGATFTTPLNTETTSYYAEAGFIVPNVTAQVGTATTTSSSSGSSPYYHGWGGVKTQYIYKVEELIAAGLNSGPITSIAFDVTSTGSNLADFTVHIGTTTQELATATHVSGLTLVYSNANQATTVGLNTYSLTGTFVWDGISNIVVQTSFSNVNTGGTSASTRYHAPGSNLTTYTYADNRTAQQILDTMTGAVSNGSGTSGGTSTSTSRANIYINGNGICASEREEVVVTVTAAPDFELSQTTLEICEGDTSDAVTITTGASDYDTFEWTPSLGVSGDATTGWSFDPTETTTYILTASQSAGVCTTSVEFTITVNAAPVLIGITASATEICEGSSVELIANSATAASYCPVAFPSDVEPITLVEFEEISNATSATVNGTPNLENFTNMAASVIAGNTYSITVNGNTNGSYTNNFYVYIDWNQNGVFTDPGETYSIGSINSNNGSGTPLTYTNILVPSMALNGNTRMRVLKKFSASTDPGSCNTTGFGQAEDYTVNVTGGVNLYDYSWSDGTSEVGTTSPLTVNPTTTTTYTVTVTGANGCTIAESIEITVNETPDAPVATSPQLIAEGQTIADIIVTGDNLTWYTDEDLTDEVDASTVLTEGIYTFYVTASIGDCTSEATMITVEVSLSTKDFDTASFKAYPNPVKDYFNISYSKDIQNIAVVNMLGQTVFTKTVNATDTQIDMTSLPTGTYFVKVNVDGAVKTIKVAKQ
jgi:hypothetical protein